MWANYMTANKHKYTYAKKNGVACDIPRWVKLNWKSTSLIMWFVVMGYQIFELHSCPTNKH
jgi:hypothetical protein